MMPVDPTLYALVRENNRILKELTERFAWGASFSEAYRNATDDHQAHVLAAMAIPGHPIHQDIEAGLRAKYAADVASIRATGEGVRRRPIAESDMHHVPKTGEVPPAHSVEERAIRREIAARINEAIGYNNREPSLEESLAVLRNRVQFGVLAGSAAALVQSRIRDAALEEAAERVLGLRCSKWIADSIRALKSKPAPETVSAFAVLEALQQMGMKRGAMDEPAPDPAHELETRIANRIWSILNVVEPENPSLDWAIKQLEMYVYYGGLSASGEHHENNALLDPEHCSHYSIRRISGLRVRCAMCGECWGKQIHAASEAKLHDFGWALQQMRAGKKVRRGDSSGVIGPIFVALRFSYNDAILDADGKPAHLSHSDLRAADWEVVE